jgi:diguanylate cyclase (GGDEF)-like protein
MAHSVADRNVREDVESLCSAARPSRSFEPTGLLAEVIDISIGLTAERDVPSLLERIVTAARRFTGAEAATLFLREGQHLGLAVVQNERLVDRYGLRELRRRMESVHIALDARSIAGYVATTGDAVNLPNAYELGRRHIPCSFDSRLDSRNDYVTRSVLAVPLRDPGGTTFGVVELLNALDEAGAVVPFQRADETLVRALASQAAAAIRAGQLEELSCKDPLTDVYNRRYFVMRAEEEAKRHQRFAEPLSLVLLDVDRFKTINDRFGHAAGDEVLKEVAQLLVNQSRSFTVVSRLGGDEFAMLLVRTPKAGAVTYAQRIRGVIERYPFRHGPVTVSLGVACVPDDVSKEDELMSAADRALYEAKNGGRNAVGVVSEVVRRGAGGGS